MHTEEVLQYGVNLSKNFLEEHPDLGNTSIYSMSKESEHDGDLIMLLNRNEVWRIEAG